MENLKIHKGRFGKDAPGYIDGRYSKTYYCKENDCNNEITYKNYRDGQGRCKPCAGKIHSKRQKGKKNSFYGKKHSKHYKKKMKERTILDITRIKMGIASKQRWENKELRERMLKNIFKARQLKPNKIEKLLSKSINKTLPKEYKFVGDGKIFFDGLCPDFININGQKKIIELFGDYWHNLPKTKKRDKNRVKIYAKYGYKTLIIWQHELKNLEKVKDKILNFNKTK